MTLNFKKDTLIFVHYPKLWKEVVVDSIIWDYPIPYFLKDDHICVCMCVCVYPHMYDFCIHHKDSTSHGYWFGDCSCHMQGKAMAPHSSTLVWKIPWMEEPGRLQSMGSLRVGHNWATSLSLFTFVHWRRKWQPTPVFLPGESQGQRSLVGCHLWGHKESDTTEAT